MGGGNGQARRAGFVSRQWAALGSGPGSAAARRLRGEGASGSAAAEDEEPLDVLLAEREDPAVPLPEPQVVIIGRATKKVQNVMRADRCRCCFWTAGESVIFCGCFDSCGGGRTAGARRWWTCTCATCARLNSGASQEATWRCLAAHYACGTRPAATPS